MITKPLKVAAVLLAGTALFASGAVVAAATTTTTNYHACVKKAGGALRVVGKTTKCTSKERRISWNSRGPAGPKGTVPTKVLALANGFGAKGTVTAAAGEPCTVGDVTLAAGDRGNGMPARGQTLQIGANTPLFTLLGTKYGGDGVTTFKLPDLRKYAPGGTNYYICVFGTFPTVS
jgi:hypothetical protein